MSRMLILLFILIPSLASAEWKLVPEQSSLSFISIKKGSVAEGHYFASFDGAISEQGSADIVVNLGSVKTGIDIRDERIREFLFQVAEFPTATFHTVIDPALIIALPVGSELLHMMSGTLALHGVSNAVTAEVLITRTDEKAFRVITVRPFVLNTGDFTLGTGLEKLRELAGLPSIDSAVPVSFSVLFRL